MSRKKAKKRKIKGDAKSIQHKPSKEKSAPINARHMSIVSYIAATLAAILFVVFGVLYSSHKQSSLWFLFFPGLVLSAVAVTFLWQSYLTAAIEHPPFAISVDTWIMGENRDATTFAAEYSHGQFTLVPVCLFVRIVNLQDVPATINELETSIRLSIKPSRILPNHWLELTPIPIFASLVSVNTASPQLSSHISFIGTRLDAALQSRPLNPHETLSGWLLFDAPRQYNSAPHPSAFRFSIEDTAGQSVVVMDDLERKQNIGPAHGFALTGTVDLTNYSFSHLADR